MVQSADGRTHPWSRSMFRRDTGRRRRRRTRLRGSLSIFMHSFTSNFNSLSLPLAFFPSTFSLLSLQILISFYLKLSSMCTQHVLQRLEPTFFTEKNQPPYNPLALRAFPFSRTLCVCQNYKTVANSTLLLTRSGPLPVLYLYICSWIRFSYYINMLM